LPPLSGHHLPRLTARARPRQIVSVFARRRRVPRLGIAPPATRQGPRHKTTSPKPHPARRHDPILTPDRAGRRNRAPPGPSPGDQSEHAPAHRRWERTTGASRDPSPAPFSSTRREAHRRSRPTATTRPAPRRVASRAAAATRRGGGRRARLLHRPWRLVVRRPHRSACKLPLRRCYERASMYSSGGVCVAHVLQASSSISHSLRSTS
jgi:hypothetical protein